jgi:regulator of replication initiation timing
MKRYLRLILAGLLMASVAVLVVDQRRIAGLRLENESLRAELALAQQSISAIASEQTRTTKEEMDRLQAEAREVHKLRNEVSQLRTGMKEADRLRVENQRHRGTGRAPQAEPGTAAAASPAIT